MKRLIVPLVAAVLGAWVMSAASADGFQQQGGQGARQENQKAGASSDIHNAAEDGLGASVRQQQADVSQAFENERDQEADNADQGTQESEQHAETKDNLNGGRPGTFAALGEWLGRSWDRYWLQVRQLLLLPHAPALIASITAAALVINVLLTLGAVRNSLRIAQMQNRAHVLVESIKFNQVGIVSGGAGREEAIVMEITVTYKNYGKSPAFNVKNFINAQVCEWPRPKSSLKAVMKKDNNERIFMGPGQSVDFEASGIPRIEPGDWRQIEERRMGLYIFGIIEYTDIHGKSRKTQFRNVANGPNATAIPTRPHAEGNYAD